MEAFWNELIRPCLEKANAKTIVEVGCQHGYNTKNLIPYCHANGGILHVIDPAPSIDFKQTFAEYSGSYVFHQDLSLNVLWKLEDYDAILLDGDHNWYTVYHELEMIERSTKRFPIVFLHDMSWPYDRRDLYYNPETIPTYSLNVYQQKGIDADTDKLVDTNGFNSHLHNSTCYNNLRCGVLTAVEDFIKQSSGNFKFFTLPVFYGFGILYSLEREYPEDFHNFVDTINVPVHIQSLLKQVDRRFAKLEIKYVAQLGRGDKLKSKVEEMEQHEKAHVSEIKTYVSEIEKQNEDLALQTKKVSELSNKISEIDVERCIEKEILDVRLSEISQLVEQIESIKKDSDSKVKELQDELNTLDTKHESECKEYEDKVKKHENRTKELQGQIAVLELKSENEIKKLQSELESFEIKHENEIKKTQDETEKLQNEIKKLQDELVDLDVKRENNIKELQDELIDLDVKREGEVGKLQSKLSLLELKRKDEAKRMQDTIKALETKRDAEYRKQQIEIADLEAKNDADNKKMQDEVLRHANSFRYQIGSAIVQAQSSPKDFIKLPFRLLRIRKEFGGQAKKKDELLDSAEIREIIKKAQPPATEVVHVEPVVTNKLNSFEQIVSENKQRVRFVDQSIFSGLVSILIVNRNGLSHLKRLFSSLLDCRFYSNYEIIVVDNASSDKSLAYLEEMKKQFALTIIVNDENMSFSYANNQAARRAEGEFLVLMNNDIQVTDGWLDEMLLVALNRPDAGTVGAKLVYPEIPQDSINKGKSWRIQHAGIGFKHDTFEGDVFIRPYNMSNGDEVYKPGEPIESVREVPAVTAATLLISKELFDQLNGLDEGYVFGYEDVDLCLKVLRKGYSNYYCPTALLFHYEFGTQHKDEKDAIRQRRTNNILLFKSKWNQYLKEKIRYWQAPLTFAFAVTDSRADTSAGDYFTAWELACALEKQGHRVKFLSRRGEADWYIVGKEVDVLVSMLHVYEVNQIKEAKDDLITIAWMRNWFDKWCANPSIQDYSILLASSNIACDYVQESIDRQPLLFSIATNSERFELVKKEVEFDYIFTGSYWNDPREIMDFLNPQELPYRFKVFGENWDKVPNFASYWGGFLPYTQMPELYRASKIVIDDANRVTKQYGAVNSRVFDALAAGALVLTNGELGAKDTFDGKLPTFSSKEELQQLISYYMENDRDRLAKIKELRELVLTQHTYDLRAKVLVNVLRRDTRVNKIAIMVPAPRWAVAEEWGDYHFAVALRKYFAQSGFETEIRILPEWDKEFDGKYVLVLRGLSEYKPKSEHINIMWNISHPDKVRLEEYELYDAVFISSIKWATQIQQKVSVPVYPLLQCTDSELFSNYQEGKKKYELLFVGNSRKVYRKIVKDLLPTELDLSVFGTNWETLIDKRYIKGVHIPNVKLPQAYHDCEILLNDHWDDMREKGFISNRLFDGLAAGAFIISDSVEGLEETLGECVVTYTNEEDLRDKIEHYLQRPEERKLLATKGQEIVLSKHSFEQRAKTILERFLACEVKPN